jgi:D-lactate dehydrogenase
VTRVSVFDTKPYDREYLTRAQGAKHLTWEFHDFRLNADTVRLCTGVKAVCIFVNDQAGRAVLEQLAAGGVKLLALRCAGFNNVDLTAARDVGIPVVRVTAY